MILNLKFLNISEYISESEFNFGDKHTSVIYKDHRNAYCVIKVTYVFQEDVKVKKFALENNFL